MLSSGAARLCVGTQGGSSAGNGCEWGNLTNIRYMVLCSWRLRQQSAATTVLQQRVMALLLPQSAAGTFSSFGSSC